MKSKFSILTIVYFALFSLVYSQALPDIDGYKTLKCDFHTHTVFSDGLVWPTIRVDEAIDEGLDAIAITDHIEYLPHKKIISTDKNISSDIAIKYGKKKGMIVIHGTEITRWMPPGHFNALFIQDANKLVQDDFLTVVEEAVSQGAFILWNHPGWKVHQPDGVVRWYDVHQTLIDRGWMHGIEFSNYHEYYTTVADLANEHDLAYFANSDIHHLISKIFLQKHSHRPLTLVFAEKKNQESIRKALFEKRTIALTEDDILAGPEKLLSNFIAACLDHKIENKQLLITNKAELPFILEDKDGNIFKLEPLSTLSIPYSKEWIIKNTYISKKKHLSLIFNV